MDEVRSKEIPWIETDIGGLRIWHLICISSAAALAILILICCCVRFRIPRTKQEIEADYRRKELAKNFRQELARIRNSDMDVLDLQKALDQLRKQSS